MNLLRVDPGLVIWLWVTFGIVLVVLRFTAWDAIMGALDKRSSKIVTGLADAEAASAKAAAMLKEYEARIAEGKLEAARIVEQARTEASAAKERMARETQEEILEEKRKARLEIEKAREDAMLSVQGEIGSLALLLASSILKREVTAADNARLIADFSAKLASRN
jgi:F-type H+-transporting ATPase subunit b